MKLTISKDSKNEGRHDIYLMMKKYAGFPCFLYYFFRIESKAL